MDVFAILGFPISHTLSPAMHNRAFEALGLDARYVAFEVAPPQLSEAVRGLSALGLRGANVTLPHKTAIMAYLDEIDPVARQIGAVNTLLRAGSSLRGMNTDAAGLTRALQEAGVALPGLRVTLLGAGGAARASVVGLSHAGVASIHVSARDPARAQALIGDLQPILGGTRLSAGVFEEHALTLAFRETDLLIQATSATLGHAAASSDFASRLPLAALPDAAVVTDLVYRPKQTSVLKAASNRGLRCVDGLGMLLHQGAIAFELWTGLLPPLGVMRAALLDELGPY